MNKIIKALAAGCSGHAVRGGRSRPKREGGSWRFTVRRNPERACTQADRGSTASRGAAPGRLLGPVPSGELAHRTRVRGGCLAGISACRTSARPSRRPLVVGGCERQQYDRHSQPDARRAQGEDRVGRRCAQLFSRAGGHDAVHNP